MICGGMFFPSSVLPLRGGGGTLEEGVCLPIEFATVAAPRAGGQRGGSWSGEIASSLCSSQ